MKKFISTSIIILILIFNISFAFSEEAPDLDVTSYILIDKDSGSILCEKESKKKIYPASTTKILTALVSLENAGIDKEITVTQSAIDAIGVGGMNIGLTEGEKLSLQNLLNAMMLSSANEAAYAIAEGSMTDYETFISTMNSRAKELGAVDSNFVNPNGMYKDDHYSTAYDLSLIAQEAMKNEDFYNLVGQASYSLPSTNMHSTWPTLPILNTFVKNNEKSDYYEKVTGIKTGYVEQSKRNLVGSAINSEGLELISVIIGADTTTLRDEYTKELLEYGFKNFSNQSVVNENDLIIENISVENSKNDAKLNLISNKNINYILPNEKSEWNIETVENIETENIEAPISKGQNFGTVEYKIDGNTIGTIELVAENTIEKVSLFSIKKIINSNILLIINIFIILSGIKLLIKITKKVFLIKNKH
jgi:D-alanyl-D-alanine carboxypeptidase/D-alanyl-D-alanine carboxypeptidase (penicillin-binding protein 5/6)